MTEGPIGPHSGVETRSNEHNYGVLNPVCANMQRIIMRLIPFSDDQLKTPESASNSENAPHMHFTVCYCLVVCLHIHVYVCSMIYVFVCVLVCISFKSKRKYYYTWNC